MRGIIKVEDTTSLTNFAPPAMRTIGDDGANNSIVFDLSTAALVDLPLGTGLKCVSGNVVMISCALNAVSVNNLPVALAALDGAGGTTRYREQGHDHRNVGGANWRGCHHQSLADCRW